MRPSNHISIAMAVYNGERFISEQLESFSKQTRLPDELVISDNASTDRTVEIVREFAARSPFPVRLFINDRNHGVTKNFERAIRESTGDLIFLSDCDDVWYPDKLAAMEKPFGEFGRVAIVLCDADMVDGNLHPLGQSIWQSIPFYASSDAQRKLAEGTAFIPMLPTYGNCMAFRSKLRSLILPFPDDPLLYSAWYDYFIAQVTTSSGSGGIALVPERLLAYRRHGGNVSSPPLSFAQRLKSHWLGRTCRTFPQLPLLIKRLEEAPARDIVNPEIRRAILRHWHARDSLPSEHWRRIPIVTRELVTRRYHRFAGGFVTALKDLLFVE
jgi:glycosyltransferase involved in cell wall biosynthesis